MKILLAIIAVVAAAGVIFFLLTRGGPEEDKISDTPGNQTRARSRANTGLPAAGPDKPETGSTGAERQAPFSVEDAKRLLDSLRTAIADGDWLQAKEICAKLAAQPAAFDLLIDILLDNASMEENDIGLRWRAAYILGLMGNKKAIAIFEQALGTEKAKDVRSNIVLALGMFKDPQAMPVLQSVFLDGEEDPGIRQSAAQYIAQIPDGSGSAFLRDLLSGQSAKDVKIWVIKALGEGADKERSGTVLADLLTNSDAPELRQAAAKGLGRIGSPDAAGALTASLRDDTDFRVRNTCARALGRFKDNPEAVSSLTEALHDDKDPTVRGCAAQGLGALESKQAVADLKEVLQKERNRVVRVRIVEALGRIGGEEARKILQNRVKNDPSVHVRNTAQEALQQLNK